jgi:hypothetical protein
MCRCSSKVKLFERLAGHVQLGFSNFLLLVCWLILIVWFSPTPVFLLLCICSSFAVVWCVSAAGGVFVYCWNRSLPSFLGRGGCEQRLSIGPVSTRPEPAAKGYEYAEYVLRRKELKGVVKWTLE